MTKARTLADNYAADINQITADAPLTGGGTSGTVTVGIQAGTTAQSGAVQLTDSTASTSITTAATPNSVKSAYDLANGAIAKSVIAAKGDLLVGTANDTVDILSTGTTGQVLTVDSATTSGLKWSTPQSGYTWTSRLYATNKGINQIAYNGSNLYVAVADSGGLYTSPDGITWTSRTSGFGLNNIFGIAYGNSIWVAVGQSGTISTSTDGVTWTTRTSNVSTNTLNAVTFANGLFVAVGNGANGGAGGITTSTNGTTWTQRSTPTVSSTELFAVAYGNSEWVAVGNNNTRQGYYSSDGTTWTVLPNLTATNFYFITYINSNWFAVPASNTIRYATTASGTWSARSPFSLPTTTISGNSYQGTIMVYDNKFYTITPQRVGIQTSASSASLILDDGTSYVLPSYYDGSSYATTNHRAIYVNATGIIVGTDNGKIYTSF